MEAILNSFKEYLKKNSVKQPYEDLGFYPTVIIGIIGACIALIISFIENEKRYQDERMKVSENFFNKADLNNDGVISESEAVVFFRGFGLPDNVINEILCNADENKTGKLSRPEFFKALRLVTVAQSNRALTPDVVKSALYGPDAAKIPLPEIKPVGPPLPVTSQRRSSSSRYPESDPAETASGENHVKMEFDRREKLHQKEIEEIHMRADAKENHHQREIKELRSKNQRLRNEQDRNLIQLEQLKKQIQELKKELDNAIKEAEELRNQYKCSICSDMSLRSQYSSGELEQATENFSDSLKIGEGGFGCVYKGYLHKTTVAIKKLNSDSLQGLSQFQQEVAILTTVRHPHLVNLIGTCSEISALVYEFLPNGSLEDRLVCANNTPALTWQARTRIISEICLALVFLHSSKPHFVIHGDLKPDNILLDTNFVSKLSDFGISRIIKQHDTDITACYHTTHPTGTFAYMDPQFLSTGKLTAKSDVYSFGIIVLRLLTGKNPLNIASGVQKAMPSDRFQAILDKSAGKWPIELAEKLAELGLKCAEMLRKNRPNMIQVWATIEPLVKVASKSPEFSSNGSAFNEEHIPLHFICPISQEIMEDPCVAADGFTYEAEAIKVWFNTGHNTSPMTNLVLPHHDLIPNHVLRSAIQEWQEHHTRI